MSSQSKKQSLGYLILGMLDTDIKASKVNKMVEEAVDMVSIGFRTDNSGTLKLKNELSERLNLTEEEKSDWGSEITWKFDGKTVEEAGEFAEYFIKHTNWSLLNKVEY